ncbi:histidine phosphatase family protein [Georgenia halophila]|uniref:Histidine phosphatase family protein n=1 Tax=Georgenia halophila TaxID=620889 RepID=A0ABP8LDS8_9MICO
MRLILVRHGQTSSNVEGLLDTGEPGADLTELGRKQAAALPEVLGDEPVGLIVTSTLVRTQQTAAPLAAALGLEPWIRDGIREVTAGDLEMRGDMEAVHGYLEAIFSWGNGSLDGRVPGGESGEEFFARYDAVIDEVAASGVDAAVVVSHGAAIRSWVPGRADNVSTEYASVTPVGNTGVVVLEGDPTNGWTALTWEGYAVGGPEIDTSLADGPAGEPVDVDA